MTLITHPSTQQAAEALANEIISFVNRERHPVLGLATGATMEPVYETVVNAHRAGKVSFQQVTTFNLDEYLGLPASHPGSYRSTMDRLLFDHIDIDPSRTFLPDGCAADPLAECARYEEAIQSAGGIGLQILGIGRNGHIAFNEPASSFKSRTRPVRLHASTLAANAGFFEDQQVPQGAITMGIGTILDARHISVLASGAAKSEALQNALRPPPSEGCPASALQLHGDVTWHADQDAAGALKEVFFC